MFADKFDAKFGDFNAYLEYMAQDGSWGDECTLECAAHLFQRPIQVIRPDPEHDRLFLPPESAPDDYRVQTPEAKTVGHAQGRGELLG